jgi:hypothetical protein
MNGRRLNEFIISYRSLQYSSACFGVLRFNATGYRVLYQYSITVLAALLVYSNASEHEHCATTTVRRALAIKKCADPAPPLVTRGLYFPLRQDWRADSARRDLLLIQRSCSDQTTFQYQAEGGHVCHRVSAVTNVLGR